MRMWLAQLWNYLLTVVNQELNWKILTEFNEENMIPL